MGEKKQAPAPVTYTTSGSPSEAQCIPCIEPYIALEQSLSLLVHMRFCLNCWFEARFQGTARRCQLGSSAAMILTSSQQRFTCEVVHLCGVSTSTCHLIVV